MNNRALLFKKFFCLGLFLAGSLSTYAEQVYDQYGRVIRSSQWLDQNQTPPQNQTTSPQTSDESAPVPPQDNPEQTNFRADSDKNYSKEDIERSNVTNLSDFLTQQGLLIMTTGGSGNKSELSFKGFTSFCIKVYVDGILANHPTTGEFDWNSIDLNSIESITVSEIPKIGITEFAGCTVLIKTKNSKKGFLFAETSLSSYESNILDGIFQSLGYASSYKSFFYRISAFSAFYDNEYKKYTVPVPSGSKPSTDILNLYNFSKQTGVNFSWNAKINNNLDLSGTNSFSYNNLKVPNTTAALNNGMEEDLSTLNTISVNQTYGNLKTSSLISYFYGQVDYFENISEYSKQSEKTNSQTVNFRQNLNWIFDASLGYKQEHLFSSSADRHQLDIGFSKEHKWNWFTFTPSLQFISVWNNSKNQQNTWLWDLQPSVTLSFFNVYLSGYRVFTLPTFNQLYWPQSSYAFGNSNLKPESGWAASVWYKNPGFPLYARFTYSYYENKIRWTSSGGKLYPQNTSNADYYIGTIGYEQEVWKNHLMLKADFTTTQARLRSTYKQIMWVPEYQAHASVAFEYFKFQLMLDYTFTSQRFTNNDNTSAYPAFHLLDASLSYKINNEFTIYAKGTNLLDQHVEYHDTYYIPSRKWTFGMKFNR